LEALLLSHDKVADVAVIGIWSKDQATELPRAYVVPADPVDSPEAFQKEIAKWVEGKVAHYKHLRGGVVLIDVIPKSPSGKILRKDLRAMVKKEEEDGVKASRQAKL
jgi:acyl-coenzyme A synthetase/AMP-(fatty) acid ligase